MEVANRKITGKGEKMQVELSKHDLMRVTGKSRQAVTRTMVGLLDVDPKAPKGAGYSRSVDLDAGWMVYFGGILIDAGMDTKQAKKHTYRTFGEMSKLGLIPSALWGKEEVPPRMTVVIHPRQGAYEFRTYERRTEEAFGQVDKQLNEGPYTVRFFPETRLGVELTGPSYFIELTGHLLIFMNGVKGGPLGSPRRGPKPKQRF
jgi:hypothetical protein